MLKVSKLSLFPGRPLECLRFLSRKKNSLSRKKALEASPTVKKEPDFAFGKFSILDKPAKTQIERSRGAIELINSFDSLRIFPSVRSAMIAEIKDRYILKNTYIKDKSELVLKPSPIQVAAIKRITQPRKVSKKAVSAVKPKNMNPIVEELMAENEDNKVKVYTIAAETGSGKTWAYLASVMSKLKEDDMIAFSQDKEKYEKSVRFQTVRVVVLVPTNELVDQVYATAFRASKFPTDVEQDPSFKLSKQLPEMASFIEYEQGRSNNLNLHVAKWGTGEPHTKLFHEAHHRRIDILVTTPSKIQSLAKLENVEKPFRLFSGVRYCVLDEADTLLDHSWEWDTKKALQRFSQLRDLIMCSATIPRDFNKTISTMFKDESSLVRIVTPLVHKIPKQIDVKVVDAQLPPFNGSKTKCLAQALYAIYNDGTEQGFVKRIIVFVNSKKDVQPLMDTIISKYGHREEDIVGLVERDSVEERAYKIEPFINPATPLEEDPQQSRIKVLITTDLTSRGLDFLGIKNVILMDLPRYSVDLVHRIGRTGRMRQSGRVFVIIDKKTRKSWIKGLPKAIKKGATIG